MPPLNCPITAFAARQDEMVYTDEIGEWSHHTDGGFELIEVDGDHWFLNRNRELIIATLQDIASIQRTYPTVQSVTTRVDDRRLMVTQSYIVKRHNRQLR